MAKGTEHARDVEARAEAMLAAEGAPDARSLIALIHEVNPTSRALSGRVVERRYALKNALQSLLIRTFGDALAVEPGPPDAPDVGLRHRYLGLDACHARVDALDEDARAWVRLQLDLGTPEHHAELQARGGDERVDDTPLGLVRRGRAAMRGYDFEEAERFLRAAFAASEGASFAAAALVELFVDVLALDESALALVEELSPTARNQPAIRAALALAALRRGQVAEGRGWLAGAAGARAAEARVLLAREALAREALDEAKDVLEELSASDPAHGELVGLREALAARFREREKPLIEQRRQEREARERARRAEIALQREAAASAEAKGDFEGALRALAAAEAAGAEVAEAIARVRKARAAELRARAIEEVLGSLEAPVLEAAALVSFGELDGAARAEVLRSLPDGGAAARACAWTAGMAGDHSHAALRGAAAAAIALVEAEREFADGQVAHAAARLHPHERFLSEASGPREVLGRIREAARQEAAEERRRVEEARRGHELRQSRRRSAAIARDHHAAAESAAANGAWLEAQKLARLARRAEQEAGPEAEPQAGTTELLAAWSRAAARESRHWMVEGALAEGTLLDFPVFLRHGMMSVERLNGAGGMLAAAAFGRELFVVHLDLRTARITRRSRWRLPLELPEVSELAVRGDALYVLGATGVLVELGLTDGGVRRVLALAPLLSPGQRFVPVGLVAVDGPPLLWVGNANGSSCVLDAETGELVRRLEMDTRPRLLPFASGPLVARDLRKAGSFLQDADGRPAAHPHWPARSRLQSAAIHPDGAGFLVVHQPALPKPSGEEKAPESAVFLRISAGGTFSDREIGSSVGWAEVVTARAHGLVFVTTYPLDRGPRLAAYRAEGTELHEQWSMDLPSGTLAGDAGARDAVFANPDTGIVVPLGSAPPTVPAQLLPDPGWGWPELSGEGLRCGTGWREARLQMQEEFAGWSEDRFSLWLEGLPGIRPGPDAWAGLIWEQLDPYVSNALGPASTHRARRIAELALARHPDAPPVLLAAAQAFVETGAWKAARDLLERLRPSSLPTAKAAEHYAHLLGVVRLHLGDVKGARAAWRAGLRPPPPGEDSTPCELDQCIAFAEVLLHPPASLEAMGRPTEGPFAAAACLLADRAFAAKDPRRALAQLRLLPRTVFEEQTAARVAAACLALPSRTPAEAFETAFLVARYLELRARRRNESTWEITLRSQLELGPSQWDGGRLARVELQGRAWLDGWGTAGEGAPLPDAAAGGAPAPAR